ncbi:hypothetical protein POW16_23600, partial [Raoultella planticola]|uniref:hypothetical protein n=1 Tax=Raoultella planticola TaxID=575 RepID=UPI002FF5C60D
PGLGRCVRGPNPACWRCVHGLTRPGALCSWPYPACGRCVRGPNPAWGRCVHGLTRPGALRSWT